MVTYYVDREADGGWISLGDVVGVDEGVGRLLVWDSVCVIVLVQNNVVDVTYDDLILIIIMIDDLVWMLTEQDDIQMVVYHQIPQNLPDDKL